jgi:uncharacterized protein
MTSPQTFLVFGGTGQTGQHFVRMALAQGHQVRALARTPSKFTESNPKLTVTQGSITDDVDLDAMLPGVTAVVAMLGDRAAQQKGMICAPFVEKLVPAMRRHGVSRFLFQAGGLSAPPDQQLPLVLRLVRATIARGYDGQHRDNEAVMRYLRDEAKDIEWMVHRAGIGGDGPSKGVLQRSQGFISIGTFRDCADYTLRTVLDKDAIHTCDGSKYAAKA